MNYCLFQQEVEESSKNEEVPQPRILLENFFSWTMEGTESSIFDYEANELCNLFEENDAQFKVNFEVFCTGLYFC